MTKEEALLFKTRWGIANERIATELRNTPISVKLDQLAIMFGFALNIGSAQ